MKKKTAMMELIEELRSLAFSKNHLGLGDIRLTQGHIDEIEEHYLKKEKEQIVDAITESEKEHYVNAEVYPPQFVVDKANTYYNQTYLEESKQ